MLQILVWMIFSGSVFGQLTYVDVKEEIFDAKCMRCHAENVMMGGVDLENLESALQYVNLSNPRSSILYEVLEDGFMPMGDEPLNVQELRLVLRWIQQGAN